MPSFRVLVSAEQIQKRIAEMGAEIDRDYPEGPVYLIGILKGAYIFLADLARAMTAHPGARRVMFVGHEPDLSSAVCLLTGAAAVRLRRGAIACLEFPGVPEPGGGELAWLLDPDLYSE